MKPMLMRSGMSGRVYIVTRYKDRGNGQYEAITKHDVTDQFEGLAREWVADNVKRAVGGTAEPRQEEP